MLFAPLASGLPFLWTVRAIEPDFLAYTSVQHRDGVAIGSADDLAGEVGGMCGRRVKDEGPKKIPRSAGTDKTDTHTLCIGTETSR